MMRTKNKKIILFFVGIIFLTLIIFSTVGVAGLATPVNNEQPNKNITPKNPTPKSIPITIEEPVNSPTRAKHEQLFTQQVPTVQILNPTDNEIIGDFITVRFTVSSDSEITYVEVYLNDTLFANISEIARENETYYYYFDADAYDLNGTYIIKIRAQNQDGWGEDSVTVRVDPTNRAGVLKILNYNILETGARPEWKDVIKEENPDIAILIETGLWVGGNDSELQAIVNEFNEYFDNEPPYQAEATRIDQTSTGGETILSRYPIISFKEIEYAPLDNGTKVRLHHTIFDAVVEIEEFDVHFIGIHLSCCESGFPRRVRDMEAVINYLDSLGNVPIIFAGDFNSHSPEDVGELAPNRGNLGTEPIEMLLNNSHPRGSTVHKWYDAYRVLNPTDPGYTYVDNMYQSRIDYIFVNQYFVDYVDLLVNATVGDTPSAPVGSDHFPVDVTINLDSPEIDLRPPFKPTRLNATILNQTAVQLEWKANTEADLSHYNVYRNGYWIGNTTNANFTDDKAPAGEILRYQVSAVDIHGNEGFKSNPLLLNTTYGLIKPPAAPTIYVKLSSDNKSVEISWTIEDTGGLPVDYFKIYRLSGDEYIFFAKVDGSKNQFIDKRVVAGKTYTYRVSAVNEVGEGLMSEPKNITLPTTKQTQPENSEQSATTTTITTSLELTSTIALLFIAVIPIIVRKRKKEVTMLKS